jgi:hypothetical protein
MITARPTSFAEALADAAWAALAPSRPRRSQSPLHRISPAVVIEATALEAACAACPKTSHDDWTMAQLTMTSLSRTGSQSGTPQLQSLRLEGDGHIAMVDVDLLEVDGAVAMRGHVVCLRHGATRAAHSALPPEEAEHAD